MSVGGPTGLADYNAQPSPPREQVGATGQGRAAAVELSIVIPALNEQDNVEPLVQQVQRSIIDASVSCELIIVDDGSTDQTLPRLLELAKQRPWLKVLHRDQPQGQSAAMHAGIACSAGTYIATLDADLQNDPAELPVMLRLLKQHGVAMVQGDRSANRKDNLVRRVGSIVGRLYRRLMLGDPVRDTGCSARVMQARYAKQIPLQFKGMHRFFPAYVQLMGGQIHQMPVEHRPRHAGTTKYGLGLLNRGISGFFDGLSVRWMGKRWRPVNVTCMTDSAVAPVPPWSGAGDGLDAARSPEGDAATRDSDAALSDSDAALSDSDAAGRYSDAALSDSDAVAPNDDAAGRDDGAADQRGSAQAGGSLG